MATSKQFLNQVKTGNVAAALQAALENAGALTIVTHIAGEGSVDDLPESHKILTHIDAVAGTIETAIGSQFVQDGPHQALCAGHMQQVVAGCSSVRDNIDSLQALLDLVTEQDTSLETTEVSGASPSLQEAATAAGNAASVEADGEAIAPTEESFFGAEESPAGSADGADLGAAALGLGAVAGLGAAGAALDSPAEDSMLDGLGDEPSPKAEEMFGELTNDLGTAATDELPSGDALLADLPSDDVPPLENADVATDLNWGEEAISEAALDAPLGLDSGLTSDESNSELGADLELGNELELGEDALALDDSLNLGDNGNLGDALNSGDESLGLDSMLDLDAPSAAAPSSETDFNVGNLDQGLELGEETNQGLNLEDGLGLEGDLSADNNLELGGDELNLDDSLSLGNDEMEIAVAPQGSDVFKDDLGSLNLEGDSSLPLEDASQGGSDLETGFLTEDAIGDTQLFSDDEINAVSDLDLQENGLDASFGETDAAAPPTNADPLAGLELEGDLGGTNADDPFSLGANEAPAALELDASPNLEEDTLAGVSWAESDSNDSEMDLGVLQLDEPADATPDPEVDALALDAISDFDSGMWEDGETVEIQEGGEQPAKVSRSLESLFSADDNGGDDAGSNANGEAASGDPLSALFSDTSLDALEGAADGATDDAKEGLTANPFEIDDLENDPFADLMLDDNQDG